MEVCFLDRALNNSAVTFNRFNGEVEKFNGTEEQLIGLHVLTRLNDENLERIKEVVMTVHQAVIALGLDFSATASVLSTQLNKQRDDNQKKEQKNKRIKS